MKANHRTAQCQVCKVQKRILELVPAEVIRPALMRLIEKEHPGW